MSNTKPNNTVVPIEKGRALKDQKKRLPPDGYRSQTPAVRRLVQCVEMLAELSRDIAKTS